MAVAVAVTIFRKVSDWSETVRFWCPVGLAYLVLVVPLSLVGVPLPFLFAGVLAGAVCALSLRNPRSFPESARRVALAVLGSGAGSAIDPDSVETLVDQPEIVLAGVISTLAISLAAGQLLRLSPHVDGPTAIFASIAGGAAGVSAVARDMNADEGTVLSIQYLRVLLVLATLPLVSRLLGAEHLHADHLRNVGANTSSLGFSLVAVVLGLALARFLRFSASSLLLPMLAATTLSLSNAFSSSAISPWILDLGYAATGLMVGVAFTPAAVRRLATLMPVALAQSILVVGGCALVGLGFARAAGLSALDGYLATTPGGLPAVTAIAIDSSASVALVITMQLVRVFVALMLAPVLGAVIRRRRKDR